MTPVVLAAGHMSPHQASLAAWAVIAIVMLFAFWGLLKLLGLR